MALELALALALALAMRLPSVAISDDGLFDSVRRTGAPAKNDPNVVPPLER